MSVQTAIVAIKNANSTLNSLVGGHFYMDEMPQQVVFPSVRFQVISRVRDYSMGVIPDLAHVRVQFDGYVKSVRSGGTVTRETLAAALRSAYNMYKGTIGGVTIQRIAIENERETIEMIGTATEADHIGIDMIAHIQEP